VRRIGSLVAAVVVAAVIAIVARPKASPLVSHPWTTYRVVYRQEIDASGTPAVRYEALSVHRPYEGSDLLSASADGSPPVTGSISTETALYDLRDDGSTLFVGGREPGPPSGDQDLATQMPDLLSRHLASDLHRSRRIAGRSCRAYRMFDPPSGPIKELDGSSEHDDLCITTGGLILDERWTLGGRVVLTRHAISVSRRAAPLPSVAGATTPQGNITSSAHVVIDPRSFLAAPPAPAGFHARPVIRLVLPSHDEISSGGASIVWAFSRGPRTISVEAGGPSARPPWRSGDTVTERVHLAHLKNAETALRSDGAEIRVALSEGRWVRIRGTVPLRTLVRYAQALRLR
jgi:hypothetical protein